MVRMIFDRKTMALKAVSEWESTRDVPITVIVPMLSDEYIRRCGNAEHTGMSVIACKH